MAKVDGGSLLAGLSTFFADNGDIEAALDLLEDIFEVRWVGEGTDGAVEFADDLAARREFGNDGIGHDGLVEAADVVRLSEKLILDLIGARKAVDRENKVPNWIVAQGG